MTSRVLSLHLRIWRQLGPQSPGAFENHRLERVSADLSLLEALDLLNERLVAAGERPVHFEHDCREGICGSCGFLVNGQAHGPRLATTVCQLYLRQFADGDCLVLEPWRAAAFPLIQDLAVERAALDRLIAAGGYCSVPIGSAPEANGLLVGREQARSAFETAACIGCGACIASCRNASASLFVAAKLAHLGQLPQGQPERARRAAAMQEQMAAEGFGSCSSQLECEAVCPQQISADWISWMHREARP
ncbi:succinate dehydrogenase/fumarate reductase iron-sulfur subunit [Vulcanococcus limneticus]|uniref:succinate dehydrogenase/fumarate reductase iron-sulfur subunit n=1 Tax=Vulcanococcus limneticus TaxID=2170428 RepID=UPI000B98E4BC|nr:succinate dehydrogenase/fumarate reductase iron-sulfur subunit [Vulcanococcus limneticus]MCP9791785.1 succinate dehydrogenase/fumarate reductase iron-sulfur subunit [Vulcanococcus limneticus MW73D5]MCP9893663.1 succinate dehydrogenase/fumarate reductase iron-sulfur subunit [Vulcanococcus limneticus Candia 3F8]MCP9897241.1 succinate dehydrogenase/fumarate reductase iron-sulfur subunit [Vulcanococcus limneticus Candia 3B3]